MVSIPKISPNLLIGLGIVAAIAITASQIRGAGKDLFGALPALDEGLRGSIASIQDAVSGISLPSISLPSTQPSIVDVTPQVVTPDLTAQGALTVEELAGATSIVQTATGVFIDGEQVRTIGTQPTQQEILESELAAIPVSEDISGAEFAAVTNEAEFRRRQEEAAAATQIPEVITPTPSVISELPSEQQFQAFAAEGSQAAEFTIRENPIDTLSEAIALGLTASQAADFLAATGGVITPSQIESGIIDPDIRNIVAGFIGGGIGQTVPVSSTPLETLSIREQENIKAAQFTCERFGLNCELADSMMA